MPLMVDIPLIVLIFSLAFALGGAVIWVIQLLSRAGIRDPSPPKGSAGLGVLYSYTLGMLPWTKDSARLHPAVYLRGIIFHLGIFTGVLVLLWSFFTATREPTLTLILTVILGLGLAAGLTSILLRLWDPKLRAISMPDDYISPALMTLFLLAAALYASGQWDRTPFYIITSFLWLYLPWSKVRHCVYFFFSRTILGAMRGHRGLSCRSDNGHLKKETL